LLLFGRGSESPRSPLNVGAVLKDMGRMMRETFPKNITASVSAPADLWLVEADRTQIHQVVLNLCVNARDAMPKGGKLALLAENAHVDEAFARTHSGKHTGRHVRITIRDTGTGITPENLEKIFDPFFTTKPVGEGTGLGLATVIGIVRGHEGVVTVRTELGCGSSFDVLLPAAKADVASPDDESAAEGPTGQGELVLVIEDEEPIRSLLQRALIRHNYDVLTASDGAEGLGVFAHHAGRVALVVTDAMMPVMGGAETVRALRQRNPKLPVVAISGLPAQEVELAQNPGPRVRFLSKPFATEHALRLIREALDEAATLNGTQPNP
jgi:CheY-like chemotaxis protein